MGENEGLAETESVRAHRQKQQDQEKWKMPIHPIETIQRMTDQAMNATKTKCEQMTNGYFGDDYYDEDDTNYENGADFFLLYCLHIITVNVFHVETGNHLIY